MWIKIPFEFKSNGIFFVLLNVIIFIQYYNYIYKDAIKSIQESLELYYGKDHGFTTRSFDLISKDHPIKTDEKYFYIFDYSGGVRKFSQEVVDFVVYKYCNDEEFMEKKGGS